VNGIWHLPGPETVTTSEILTLISAQVGHPVAARSVPKLLMRGLGLVNPMMRGLAEMAYEFEAPFILDTSKYETTFGTAGTPLIEAIATTIAWYRNAANPSPQTGSTPQVDAAAAAPGGNGIGGGPVWTET
jgi:hypothetical protein